MLGNTYDSQVCSIARALELVGERWSLLILRDALFRGSTHFSDFQKSLGVAANEIVSLSARRILGFAGGAYRAPKTVCPLVMTSAIHIPPQEARRLRCLGAHWPHWITNRAIIARRPQEPPS